MRTIGYTFFNEGNDFVQYGICETYQKDENSEIKISFWTISTKQKEMKHLTNDEIHRIHDILKGFGSYKAVIGGQNKDIIGLKSVYIEDEMWENIKGLLKTGKK